jgi:hypothetical protein
MRRLSLIVLLVSLWAGSVRAQDGSTGYRLRVPTAEEYMNGVHLISQWETERTENISRGNYPFRSLVDTEMTYRYPDLFAQRFSLLNAVYEALDVGEGLPINVLRDRGVWNRAMILAWLGEQSVDLDAVDHLEPVEEGGA